MYSQFPLKYRPFCRPEGLGGSSGLPVRRPGRGGLGPAKHSAVLGTSQAADDAPAPRTQGGGSESSLGTASNEGSPPKRLEVLMGKPISKRALGIARIYFSKTAVEDNLHHFPNGRCILLKPAHTILLSV